MTPARRRSTRPCSAPRSRDSFPPVNHGGEVFTDGGVASNLPVLVAIARGATEIWAIDLANQPSRSAVIRGAFSISTYCGQYLLYQTVLRELECVVGIPGITLHHLPIYAHQNIMLGDFSKVDAMVSEGARVAEHYLAQPRPNQIQYPKAFGPDDLPAGPPGARPFAFSEVAAARAKAIEAI